MSAVSCRTGLAARIGTITGLKVVTAEPTSIQVRPLAIISLIGGTLNSAGQVKVRTWRFQVRVVTDFHDNIIAEDQLVPFADSVTNAILADLTLGARANVVPNIDISAEGPDGYYSIGDPPILYRSIVFRMDIRDKL